MDFIVEFQEDFEFEGGLFARYFGLKEELEQVFATPVDLVMANALRNQHFVEPIKPARRTVYAS